MKEAEQRITRRGLAAAAAGGVGALMLLASGKQAQAYTYVPPASDTVRYLLDKDGNLITPAKEDGNLASIKTNTDLLSTGVSTSPALGKTWPISNANLDANLDGKTSLLAKETGGNLASILAQLDNKTSTLATSPIVLAADIGNFPGTAAAGFGQGEEHSYPDGVEIAAGQQIGVSHVESSTSSTVSFHLVGFEY